MMQRPCLALLALLAACTTGTSRPEPALAAFGEAATAGPVSVTPRTLLEDSRCPQAVHCVWQGPVRIEALVNGHPTELTLGQPVPVGGGALLLAEVRPSKGPQEDIPPAAYRFRFSFTGESRNDGRPH